MHMTFFRGGLGTVMSPDWLSLAVLASCVALGVSRGHVAFKTTPRASVCVPTILTPSVLCARCLQTPCQQELDQVLERIATMRLPDDRGPLEHLYSLHIPNCDKHGLYNLKQVSVGANLLGPGPSGPGSCPTHP